MTDMIYLDNAATTFPKPEQVYAAMDKTNRELGVNAGRGLYRLARDASKLISETKDQLRRLVAVDISAAVVFSPSITIALNQIINGIEWPYNATVYLSPYEHNAVARTINKVCKENNVNMKLLPINEDSLEIDLEKVKYEFSQCRPFAVFCTHVSNVTGYVLPVEDIFREAKRYDSITVLDTAQSLGLVDVNSKTFNADIIAFAGHKTLYGPFGIGGFINISGLPLKAVVTGGTGSDSLNLDMPDGPESKYEAASENIVAIAGLHAALSVLDVEGNYWHEKELSDYLIEQLKKNKKIKMYLPADLDRHVGIVSFTHDDYNSDDLGTILDEDFDIAVRTGYHCAPFIHSYLKDKNKLGTVRVSMGRFSEKADIEKFVEAMEDI